MKPNQRLTSENMTISDKFPQTAVNELFEYIKDNNNNSKDNKEKSKSNSKQNKEKKSKNKLIKIRQIPKEIKIKKIQPFSYRYFQNITTNKKKTLNSISLGVKTIKENDDMIGNFLSLSKDANKSISLGVKTIKENDDMIGNFLSLSKDANKYTSNVDYIQNKKMQLLELNEKNKTERDKSDKSQKNNINHILYKTTFFRSGKYFFNKGQKRKKKLIKKINIKMSIRDIVDYLEQNEDKINIFMNNKEKKRKIIIEEDYKKNDEKNNKKKYFSFYKKLMFNKNKIIDNIIHNEFQKMNNVYTYKTLDYNNNNLSQKLLQFNNTSKNNNSKMKIDNYYNSSYEENNTSNINKKNFTNSYNFYSKKKEDNLPLIFPNILSSTINYSFKGKHIQYENILENFTKIKNLIENDKDIGKKNEYKYIKEFLKEKKIEKKYLKAENIIKFANFLRQPKINIDINKSLKENILLALNYKEDNYSKNINSEYNTIDKSIGIFHKKKYNSTRNKIIKRDKLNLDNYINTKRKFNINKNKYKSLLIDLRKQNKLYEKEEEKTVVKLRDELKKEINKVEDDIKNKQDRIKNIEEKMNLIPFSSNYFNNKKIENKNKNKNNMIRLRLISLQEMRNNLLENLKITQKNNSNNDNEIFNSNERLYYSWFRHKTKRDINKFLKTTKLTELVVYNKTKEKILKDQFKDEFLQKNSI